MRCEIEAVLRVDWLQECAAAAQRERTRHCLTPGCSGAMEAKLRVLKRKLDSRDTDIPEEGDVSVSLLARAWQGRWQLNPARWRGAALPQLAFKRTRTAAVKQRVLVFSARGVTSRFRHLMEDVRKLLPHHKKDAKVRAVPLLHAIAACSALIATPPRSWT